MLYAIASGKPGFEVGGFASNGYGAHSPGGYSMGAVFLCEVVMSGFFVLIIMGSTDKRAAAGFFGLTIGLALTVIHLVSIPVTNTSVNPARSTGPAIVQSLMNTADAWALGQLWLFWVAPIIGGVIGGLIYRYLWGEQKQAAAA